MRSGVQEQVSEFPFKSELYTVACGRHALFICLFICGRLGGFLLLAFVSNDAVNVDVECLSRILLSVLLDVYPKVELLDHLMVLLF